MIIRERNDAFVMIAQHDHGRLSGDFASRWKPEAWAGDERREDVVFAAYEHDRCWLDLDDIPIWNDGDRAPYHFIDYPIRPKLICYGKGIDGIKARRPYAGLLTSLHFSALLAPEQHPAVREYLEARFRLEEQWKRELGLTDETALETLDFHLRVLQFCDHLSLYVCLNEPGSPKDEEMPWYRDGIPGSERFPFSGGRTIVPRWQDAGTIAIAEFPFDGVFRVGLRGKTVTKAAIQAYGLAKAYDSAPFEQWLFAITPG
ncbi:serine hydroxymethyltransferase [Paenibacillus cisolokensis]|uniref:Serine hydroxymethyltransferase n=1 Tax=Paenibacillus cisolokensis TaxID=1658519 RepID=A0ABQ4N023_9BACL|nr:DUF3891 family protein [Paenibacillus cisolokensis]GIQ61499.1 serine hydroxymethyltransferase [Paenibacillus cisolokensis]